MVNSEKHWLNLLNNTQVFVQHVQQSTEFDLTNLCQTPKQQRKLLYRQKEEEKKTIEKIEHVVFSDSKKFSTETESRFFQIHTQRMHSDTETHSRTFVTRDTFKTTTRSLFLFVFFQGVSLTSFTSSSKIQTLCPLASLKHDNRLRPQEVAKHTSTLGLHSLFFFFFCRKYCFTEYMLVFFSDDRISDGSLFFFPQGDCICTFKSKRGFCLSLLTPL